MLLLRGVGDELEELDADAVGRRQMGDLHALEVGAEDVGDDLAEIAVVGVTLDRLHQHVAAEDIAIPGDGGVDVGHRDADMIERPHRPCRRSRRAALPLSRVLVVRHIHPPPLPDPIPGIPTGVMSARRQGGAGGAPAAI